jgi:uncharacterized membrane protein
MHRGRRIIAVLAIGIALGVTPLTSLLMAPGATPPNNRLPVVTAPSSRGIALFRTLIDHESRLAEIDAWRRNADCLPYQSG